MSSKNLPRLFINKELKAKIKIKLNSNNIPWGLSYRDAKKNFFIIDIFV